MPRFENPPYYITAYGLAVKRGFKGTLDEWIASLTGDAATLVSKSVAYQSGDSGSIIPSGTWVNSVPVVSQGKYLWTKTELQFNTGDPIVFYSVARMGIDGSGSVSMVNNVSPDSDGNVKLTAADVGALPSSGGDMTGAINMNGQKISGLNDPTESTEAARKGYVDGAVKKAAPRNLLDNSDFTNPVAQAGIGGNHGTVAYVADRWILDSGTVSYKAGVGLTLNGTIRQKLEYPPTGETSAFVGMASGSASISYTDGAVTITSSGGVLKWAALYSGVYSADTMPEYQPKGYTAELLECRRYYRKIDAENYFSGVATGSNKTASFMLQHEQKMRTTPTVTASDNFSIVVYTQTGYSTIAPNTSPYGVPAEVVCTTNTDNGMNIQATFGVSGVASENNTPIMIRTRTGYLDISADL